MEKPSFVVRLADLERGPKKLTLGLSEAWLSQALSDASAVPLGPGEATVELTKMGGMVLVRGRAQAKLTVPCVVTLDPVPLELAPEIFLQLARDPDPPDRAKGGLKTEGKKPEAKQKAGKARGAQASRGARDAKDDDELSAEEAASDFYRGEEIVLDDFIREFLLLEIPPYPRRSDLPSPEESISSRPLADPNVEAKPLDPRLAPLLGIASRLKGSANKE